MNKSKRISYISFSTSNKKENLVEDYKLEEIPQNIFLINFQFHTQITPKGNKVKMIVKNYPNEFLM